MNTMNLEKILKANQSCGPCFSVEKVGIETVDGDPLVDAELKTDHPDLPIIITQGASSINIASRDIPQFITAIAAMFNEKYC